jgi:ABC-2 type transport system permease protein
MSEASRPPPAAPSTGLRTGNIYDLGYRNYEGVRLGRRYAFTSLFIYTLLAIWGIGRSWVAKLFVWGLTVIALLPAVIILAVAALVPEEFEVAQPEDYFGFVSIVLALICAVVAPDLIGRDQRHHTLSLYFSRALSRLDYASSKFGALFVSLFLVLAVPQVFLQLGNAVATDDLTAYLEDNLDVIPPVIGSSAVVAALMAALTMAISIFTSRRAFATGAVIAAFVILTVIGGILVETLDGDARQYSLLASPILILEGAVYWIFGVEAPSDSDISRAGLDGGYYLVAALAYAVLCLAVYYRRILRMSV